MGGCQKRGGWRQAKAWKVSGGINSQLQVSHGDVIHDTVTAVNGTVFCTFAKRE